MSRNLPQRSRVERALSRIRLVDLAKRAGIGASHASLVLSGKRNPSAKVLRSLSKALGVTSDDLLAYIERRRGAG